MRKAITAAILLLAACGDTKKTFEESFKVSFEKSFVESCVKGAMDSGATPDRKPRITDICGCAARKLVTRYSMSELTAMSGGDQQKVVAAVQECKTQ